MLFKDIMISNVAKTLEASTQAILIHNACSAFAVKRKRNESWTTYDYVL